MIFMNKFLRGADTFAYSPLGRLGIMPAGKDLFIPVCSHWAKNKFAKMFSSSLEVKRKKMHSRRLFRNLTIFMEEKEKHKPLQTVMFRVILGCLYLSER